MATVQRFLTRQNTVREMILKFKDEVIGKQTGEGETIEKINSDTNSMMKEIFRTEGIDFNNDSFDYADVYNSIFNESVPMVTSLFSTSIEKESNPETKAMKNKFAKLWVLISEREFLQK